MRVTQAHFFLFYSISFLTTFCDPMNWIHNLQMGCDPQFEQYYPKKRESFNNYSLNPVCAMHYFNSLGTAVKK